MGKDTPADVNISIIIVNYKSSDFLLNCIRSVYESQLHVRCEIIVIDNASLDAGLGDVKKRFPGVLFIDAEENKGYAAGNNIGLRFARGETLLLLNPDTIVNKNTIQHLYDHIHSDPKIGIVGPQMVYPDGRRQTKYAMKKMPSLAGIFSQLFFLDNIFPKSKYLNSLFGSESQLLEKQYWQSVNGACLMIKREVIDKIGQLDEHFFLYFEEIDWCFRAVKEGYKILYVPSASLIHFEGGIAIPDKKNSVFAYHESQLYLFKKHYGKFQCTALYLLSLLGFSFRFLLTPVYMISGKNAATIRKNFLALLFHLQFSNYRHILKLTV